MALVRQNGRLQESVRAALAECGILARITAGTRVALKPNFTYPYYKPGVTTSPAVIRAAVQVLKEYTEHIAIVEGDGGSYLWKAEEAFDGHGIRELEAEFGVTAVNLIHEPAEYISFRTRGGDYRLPLPARLLHETDLLISMPVPKVHAITRLTLGYKNQWGCLVEPMRLRHHHVFNDAIVAINRVLKPVVLADGTYFLDRNGPMDGQPVRMDLILAATDPGAFDRYVSELMGISWRAIPHLRRAAALGDLPRDLAEIEFRVSPAEARAPTFRLQRTLKNWVAVAGFNSRVLTWLLYDSWLGRVVIHGLMYAVTGPPLQDRTPASPGPARAPVPR